MAENVQYTGRLGLESRETGTLSAAVNAVVDTLDDFGQSAERIEARAENAARLQCNHYLVTVRLRRVPLRRASKLPSSVLQPAALLELTLSPVFPAYCDQEISELLLAETLRRLLSAVEATSVEWLDSGVALTCEQFLSVFAPEDCIMDQTAAAASATVARQLEKTVAPKPRGRACFTPVEQTAIVLDAHCDRAFQAAQARSAARATAAETTATLSGGRMTAGAPRRRWGGQLQASALAAFNLTGSRRLRLISHLLLLTALVLYLDSADMVQAARPLIP